MCNSPLTFGKVRKGNCNEKSVKLTYSQNSFSPAHISNSGTIFSVEFRRWYSNGKKTYFGLMIILLDILVNNIIIIFPYAKTYPPHIISNDYVMIVNKVTLHSQLGEGQGIVDEHHGRHDKGGN